MICICLGLFVVGGFNWVSLLLKLFVGGNVKFWDLVDIDFMCDWVDWEKLLDDECDYVI